MQETDVDCMDCRHKPICAQARRVVDYGYSCAIGERRLGREMNPEELRISKIVDELIEEDEDLKSVDRSKIMESLSNLMEDPPSDLMSITDDELKLRIERVMFIEVLSEMLNDLNPEQMKSFEAAIKRREFFK